VDNRPWRLESFVDSLVVELDKTREILAVKSVNKPLTYTVKDIALDLQIFPTYDGENVEFQTAQPGQDGASKLTVQLASITDQQVRATTKPPPGKGDVKLDSVDIDPSTKKQLRKLGVTSAGDLEELEKKDIDLHKVGDEPIDYKNLANLIQKARRRQTPPRVEEATLRKGASGRHQVVLSGQNLSLARSLTPVAILDSELGDVLHHDANSLVVELARDFDPAARNELIVTLDPYCILKMQLVTR
jgi:hypothetical protein